LTVNVWFGWSPSMKHLRQRSCVLGSSEGIPTSDHFRGTFSQSDADVFYFRKLDSSKHLVRSS
jgi:hypothetical protein